MIRTILKILGGLVALVVIAAAGFYVYLSATWKKSYAYYPRPAISASTDTLTIARGDYLVHAVAHCPACHQNVDAYPTMKDALEHRGSGVDRDLVGGLTWDIPVFGRFVAANLTSDAETGIGAMNDADLARLLRHGVKRDGTIAPLMYLATGPMSDEDLTAVVSYLRSLKPVRHENRTEAPGIMGKLVLKGMKPRHDTHPPYVPAGGVSIERGAYLANGPAACFTCHSTADPMRSFAIVGPRFQGDAHAESDLTDPAFEIVTPNLTPDPTTGHITGWSEDDFAARFKAGPVYKGSKMPWDNFALMTEEDSRSIYRYLMSLDPVAHQVGPVRRSKGWKPGQ